jgi:hypothetical protein
MWPTAGPAHDRSLVVPQRAFAKASGPLSVFIAERDVPARCWKVREQRFGGSPHSGTLLAAPPLRAIGTAWGLCYTQMRYRFCACNTTALLPVRQDALAGPPVAPACCRRWIECTAWRAHDKITGGLCAVPLATRVQRLLWPTQTFTFQKNSRAPPQNKKRDRPYKR